jgi:hypothetical protein
MASTGLIRGKHISSEINKCTKQKEKLTLSNYMGKGLRTHIIGLETM